MHVISPEVLPLLGVTPLLGRTFTGEDNQTDNVILGYGLWQSMFGSRSESAREDDQPVRLLAHCRRRSAALVQISILRSTRCGRRWVAPKQESRRQSKNRSLRIFNMLARLKADVTIDQAQAD